MNTIIKSFNLVSEAKSVYRYGNGHINETYKVDCKDGSHFILQKINKNIFTDPIALMENISAVCSHIASVSSEKRNSMTIIKTIDGRDCYCDEKGDYYRVYEFIEDSICLEKVEEPKDFYESAYGFGSFQRMLATFDASVLHETIKNFHDTPKRYERFKKVLAEDKLNRVKLVESEIDFALAHEKDADYTLSKLRNGEIPLRVTHNDTKLNNVLLDANTRKALCVIDLDTVMPGLSVNDFGDSIRFGATSAAEDEPDLSKVNFVPELYRIYTEGFLAACGKALTDKELELLPWGAKLMTLECGVRFLTDFLEGDVYFRTNSPEHNMLRTRTQFKLVSDMEEKWSFMENTVREVKAKL